MSLIVANLTYSVLLSCLKVFKNMLLPGGHLLISGLQGQQADGFKKKLTENNYTIKKTWQEGKWQALLVVTVTVI